MYNNPNRKLKITKGNKSWKPGTPTASFDKVEVRDGIPNNAKCDKDSVQWQNYLKLMNIQK